MPVKWKICDGCGRKYNEIVEECYDSIIKYIDEKYSADDEFIQNLFTSLLQFDNGMKFAVRAFHLMESKRE